MLRITPLLFALACAQDPVDDSDVDSATEGCVAADQRTYDTAEDPGLYDVPDAVMGISNQDVADAMLGSFDGTYTPDQGDAFLVEVSMSVDGIIVVQDYDGPDCPSVWSAPLVYAMSSEKVDGGYLIDDLWSPVLSLGSLTAGTFVGAKPADEFDGTIQATGEARIEASYAADSWTGTLAFGDAQHGTFVVSRGD